jgi:transposase
VQALGAKTRNAARTSAYATSAALEAGAQSAWISRELKRLGHEVIVANRRDPGDAILRARTLLINSARSIAKGFGGATQVDHPHLRRARHGCASRVSAHGADRIAPADRRPQRRDRRLPSTDRRAGRAASGTARLESIPGVGRLTALTFVLTLGRAERFAHSRDVAGFLGLRPKQRQLRISQSGDPYMRKLLVRYAHHVLGPYGKDSALRQGGLAKSAGGKKATLRAIVAVARKLSVLLHRLWASGEFYKPFPKMA